MTNKVIKLSTTTFEVFRPMARLETRNIENTKSHMYDLDSNAGIQPSSITNRFKTKKIKTTQEQPERQQH